MIKIQNLKKIYNGTTVLDIESLDIAQGELVGLVGNNGAGKTTLLRLVLDLIKADDGFVESDGKKVNESEDWKTYTGSYIDGRFLVDFLTPEEYFSFIGDVYGIDEETMKERLAPFETFMHDEIMGTKKQGTTVIISSHNLNFVADISSRILLLEKGKLIKDLQNTDGAAIAELNEYFGIQAE